MFKGQMLLKTSSYRSEWDEGSQSTERLSEYLFFLRGRGKTLLENYISTNENSENDDFHQLLLRVLATLAPLSTRLCSPSMVSFQPTPELKIQPRVSSSQGKKKGHSRSNSTQSVPQQSKYRVFPIHRHDFRIFSASVSEEDKKQDYSEVFGLILSIVAKVSFRTLLDLQLGLH